MRGSYTEAFHAPTLPDLTPAGIESFGFIHDPKGLTPDDDRVRQVFTGNPNLKPEVAYEWSYGTVYSPKWIKGLTLSADYWHIDLRSIAASVGPQFIVDFENQFPGLVERNPTTGAIEQIIDPHLNLTRAVVEGVDYEAIYILDSSIFGRGDFGRLTFTLNGTYLSRFEFQATPFSKRIGLSGEFVTGASFTGSLPHNRAYASAFYDGPAGTWLAGFDIGATVHYTGQYEDNNIDLVVSKPQTPRTEPKFIPSSRYPKSQRRRCVSAARKVAAWTTLDLIASYTFNLPPPAPAAVPGLTKDGGKNIKMKDGKEKNVMPVSTAEYNPCGWRAWLNGTTLTLGCKMYSIPIHRLWPEPSRTTTTNRSPPSKAGSVTFSLGRDSKKRARGSGSAANIVRRLETARQSLGSRELSYGSYKEIGLAASATRSFNRGSSRKSSQRGFSFKSPAVGPPGRATIFCSNSSASVRSPVQL